MSYQPCKFQLSGMSGSNLTEGGGKHPPSAAQGEKAQCFQGKAKTLEGEAFWPPPVQTRLPKFIYSLIVSSI